MTFGTTLVHGKEIHLPVDSARWILLAILFRTGCFILNILSVAPITLQSVGGG